MRLNSDILWPGVLPVVHKTVGYILLLPSVAFNCWGQQVHAVSRPFSAMPQLLAVIVTHDCILQLQPTTLRLSYTCSSPAMLLAVAFLCIRLQVTGWHSAHHSTFVLS